MTILEGLRYVAEELEKVPVAGMENRERMNNCARLLKMMIDSSEKMEVAPDGGCDDADGQRQAENDAGAI